MKRETFDGIRLAIVHAYCWIDGHAYPGVPMGNRLAGWEDKLTGYSAAAFGDNHDGFLAKCGEIDVLNCGCLIRRKRDELKYLPTVGLLHDDGHIERVFLDCSEDKWLDPEEQVGGRGDLDAGLGEFLEELRNGETEFTDFRTAVLRYIKDNGIEGATKRCMLEVLGE